MKKPLVKILGERDTDLVPSWSGSGLVGVSFLDNDGAEADELTVEFAVSPPFQNSPAEGKQYRLLYGWEGGPLRDGGFFTYQSDALHGDPEGGYFLTITARSSDFIDADKAAETEHFDEMAAGDIFAALASRSGKQAIVHPDIASIRLPYRLRHNQSLTGFANELAAELGGTLKFAGGKMLVPMRSSGMTASGQAMPTIVIPFGIVQSFDISSEGRGKYQEIGAPFFDPLEGVQKFFEGTSIGAAARYLSLHPARSEQEAAYAGKAEIGEEARGTISGSITTDGDTDAMAGAPVKLQGFGAGRDGLDLIAASIEHQWTFDDGGGWLMTIEIASRSK